MLETFHLARHIFYGREFRLLQACIIGTARRTSEGDHAVEVRQTWMACRGPFSTSRYVGEASSAGPNIVDCNFHTPKQWHWDRCRHGGTTSIYLAKGSGAFASQAIEVSQNKYRAIHRDI